MDKFWENYIKTRPANSKGAFDAFAAASRDPEPRNMAQGGRIGFQGGLAVTGYNIAKPFINPLIKKWYTSTDSSVNYISTFLKN